MVNRIEWRAAVQYKMAISFSYCAILCKERFYKICDLRTMGNNHVREQRNGIETEERGTKDTNKS